MTSEKSEAKNTGHSHIDRTFREPISGDARPASVRCVAPLFKIQIRHFNKTSIEEPQLEARRSRRRDVARNNPGVSGSIRGGEALLFAESPTFLPNIHSTVRLHDPTYGNFCQIHGRTLLNPDLRWNAGEKARCKKSDKSYSD